MYRVGVHTSVRNGFASAVLDAAALGCTTFQMFTQSPRGWKTRQYTDDEFKAFRQTREKSGLNPVVVHSPYLPNLCTSDADLYEKSVTTLKADLDRCEKLGAQFLVIHPGAYSPTADYETGLTRLHEAINGTLEAVPGDSRILIENMAGGGRRLGGSFAQMRDMLKGIKDQNRVGVCFDTCHAMAAGYDVSSAAGVKATYDEFEKEVGLERIFAFHVNDSKSPLGSHRDRHEHLGRGAVGLAGFKELFRNPIFKKCAFILETPKDTPQADPANLKTLRSCLPSERNTGVLK